MSLSGGHRGLPRARSSTCDAPEPRASRSQDSLLFGDCTPVPSLDSLHPSTAGSTLGPEPLLLLPPLPVPSSGPTNVSALATTSSSMLVRWNEVPEADRNGLVLGYKVRGSLLPRLGTPSWQAPGAQDAAF